MVDYLPISEDIVPQLVELAVDGDIDAVSMRLDIAKDRLQRLISQDPEAIDLIRATQAEFEAFLRLRALMLSPDALNTLAEAMHGDLDSKKAMAAVRAAESILDRTALPKVTRQSVETATQKAPRALPDLNDLMERAKNDDQAHQVVDQYREAMRLLDAMRRGAKEVIDGEVVDGS